jgi:multicomponent Na+:H+ antiporter subunit D
MHELGEDKFLPFYSLAMLLLAGLSGLVITGDLFNLYVFLEISALASYALVAMGDKPAPLGAFRYLTLGTSAAAFYLIGLALIFLQTGSLNMADIAHILHEVPDSRPIILGIILIVLGVGLKMAVFPMHAWLADAYTYASSSATALIAPIGTKVSAYVLIRFMFFVIGPEMISEKLPVATLIGYLGMIGMIWGSLLAVCQKELKRMLAYSSVAQVGYIALGIGLANPFGFIGAVLHALNHACMKACLFFVSGNMRFRQGHSFIPDFKENFRLSMPWSSGAFALAAVSMVGLPPTAGFFSKWYLALGSIEQSNWIFVAALVLSSLLNAVYFFRVLEKIYMKPVEAEKALETGAVQRADAPGSMIWPTLLLAAGVLVLGIFNAYIVTTFIMPMIPQSL